MYPEECAPPHGFYPFEAERFFYNSVGPMFTRYSGGRLTFGFRVLEKHVNAAQIAHGGMLFTLMDMQMGLGASVDTGVPGFVVTVNLTTDFLAPARIGQWVQAESRIVKQTRSLIFSDGTLQVDGEIILRANSVLKAMTGLGNFDIADFLPPEYLPEPAD
jgi:uncharacterized protein (TIGR00369 family)